MSDKPWTSSADVVAVLRRRWDRGELLTHVASGESWEPIRIPVRGPTARQIGQDLGAVQTWVTSLRQPGWRLETRSVGGRLVGANEIPAAVWFDTADQAFARLRVGATVTAYRELLDVALAADPGLARWASEHPLRALRHTEEWERVVRTVLWLRDRVGSGVYLRQIDVPGVDTKFIEAREGLLGELLDAVGCERTPGSGRRLERGYGFAEKPDRIRLRRLDGAGLLPTAPFSDLSVRVDELTDLAPPCTSVLVVENEVTFLALPRLPGVVAVFGAGFDVLRLARVRWLDDTHIVYWGDIDTHGFVILDRLRATFPGVQSVLMDATTLTDHRGQWVSEPRPSSEHLGRLTEAESGVYADLVGDVHGTAVRLEQERINYSRVQDALQVLANSPLQQLIDDGLARPARTALTELPSPTPGPPISAVLQQMRDDERY
ncbi:DUF3322 and DUF2220 domain-containing protein [soil metagenome]